MTYLEEYAHAVLDGKIVANEKIKKEYKRLLFDFENPSLSRWHYDPILGNRPVEFIEKFCKQSKGKLGKPLKLELFQKAFLNAAFGFVDENGIRRFQEVLLVIGRKNGKTTLLAGIELYCATADGEGAPEVYNVATSRDQANIGFTECVNMVSQSPLLKRHWHKRQSDLYFKANKGIIKALASNTNGLDGLNTHCATIDELAAIKNRDLYDPIKQSMSARSQPLLAEITTNGFVRDSIFDSQYEYATGVINGTIDEERF
jgi:phage terminase large subunit-like protein